MHNKLKKVETEKAPKAIGPYSQGVKVSMQNSSLLFVSGQLPVNPETGKLIEGDIAAMTRRVLSNIEAILKEGGTCLEDVVKVEVFLSDIADYKIVSQVYAEFFKGEVLPARQAVEVSSLPLGAQLEISCIALCH